MRWFGRRRLWPGVALSAVLAASAAQAQSGPRAAPATGAVSALMISDIHFDPFHDPEKAKLLARDPVSKWAAVLAAPGSPRAAASFEQLQAVCRAKGVDTPYALLRSSLEAMRARSQPEFVTLSGDLIAHRFDCRYRKTVGDAAGYEAFVEKTLAFVVGQLRAAWPGVPVYISLGNNDSACGDYRLDPDSAFLRRTAAIFGEGLPVAERHDELREFPVGGYYSVDLVPLPRTRLIVLNDVFQSLNYRTCAGARDAAPGVAEMAWLAQQLEQVQREGEKVWVMGHIPPGVNVYATVRELPDLCGTEKPVMFLDAGRLDDLLLEHAGEVRLALFAHTHMDEMRLLEGGSGSGVAVKLVPSISPVDGNNPAFTVARVDRTTAVLKDYEVFAASNQTGVGTQWTNEYDYAEAYHQPAFTPSALRELIAEFQSDRKAKTAASQEYIRDYYVGGEARELTPFWPQYVCSLEQLTVKGYAGCVCGK
jgi:sphingomyelin phosphodiesterase acid-like 3